MRKVLDKCRDDRDNDQGREYNAQSRDDTANGAGKSLSDKGRRIYRDNARGTLADRVIVHKFLFCCPVSLLNDLSLEDRKHRVSTAKGKTADAGKRKEEIQ